MVRDLIETLVVRNEKRIVYLICDGLGGANGEDGRSELQVASLPNLDRLARESSCGLLDPVMPGVTPGSGPGHLALFGYAQIYHSVCRVIFFFLMIRRPPRSTLFPARVNFAT